MEESKPIKKRKSNRNRNAGHGYERKIVQEIIMLGFPHASTSRRWSRGLDDAKVDICNANEHINGRLPYNIQCKTVQGNLSYGKVLSEMPKGEMNVVLHNSTKKSEKGLFRSTGQYAIMSKETFYELLKRLHTGEEESNV